MNAPPIRDFSTITHISRGKSILTDIIRANPQLTHVDVQEAVLHAFHVLRTDTVIDVQSQGDTRHM